jgi:hypothetical protein
VSNLVFVEPCEDQELQTRTDYQLCVHLSVICGAHQFS